ncbi:MAG TPA: ChaN family lipoprotein, partial [Polyangiaceae bacterium]|nr:ChaN family lipoprotein [Polyangiaceae bacterium]
MRRSLGSCLVACLGLVSLACAKRTTRDSMIGVTPQYEQEEEEPREAPVDEKPEADVVAQAARPFTGYRVADERSFARESFLTHLAAADAICIGERHGTASDHFAELSLINGLAERRALRGFELGLGMEMLRTKQQGMMNAYLDGTYGLETFAARSLWRQEWGFPIEYYAPTLQAARDAQVTGVALGVDRKLGSSIAQKGLAGLTSAETFELPHEIDLGVAEHRKLFDALTKDHPHGDPEFMYQTQVVWDEAMAERGAAFLSARAPGRKLLILAGAAHCHRAAIPARLARRGNFRVVSVLPVEGQPHPVSQSSQQPSAAPAAAPAEAPAKEAPAKEAPAKEAG